MAVVGGCGGWVVVAVGKMVIGIVGGDDKQQ